MSCAAAALAACREPMGVGVSRPASGPARGAAGTDRPRRDQPGDDASAGEAASVAAWKELRETTELES
jgi:hypothetical protein